jgi:hypothetical protein
MAKFTKEEKIKMLENKLKDLKASTLKEQRKIRAKKLIEIGAFFSSILDVETMHEVIRNDGDGKFKKYVSDYYPLKDKIALGKKEG